MDAGRNRPSKSPPLGTEFAALTALMVHRNQPATGHVRRLRRRAVRHTFVVPWPEGRLLGDVGASPQPETHLVQAKGIIFRQSDANHAQLCAQRTIRKRHALTVEDEVRLT
jgi:hypothetical protein